MDIAEALLAVGAEVNRVEDTLTRMGTAYGAVRMNAFVITSSIVVTMTLPSGRDITQTRRILTPGGTDFTVLEALNDLSRRCCADPIPLDELRREVAQITAVAPKPLLVYLGSALAAGSCALFFGGSMTDGLVHLLRREAMSKGVNVIYNEDESISIELHIIVENGVNIPAVCRSIMNEVRYVVNKNTGAEVRAVDVFVDSMIL